MNFQENKEPGRPLSNAVGNPIELCLLILEDPWMIRAYDSLRAERAEQQSTEGSRHRSNRFRPELHAIQTLADLLQLAWQRPANREDLEHRSTNQPWSFRIGLALQDPPLSDALKKAGAGEPVEKISRSFLGRLSTVTDAIELLGSHLISVDDVNESVDTLCGAFETHGSDLILALETQSNGAALARLAELARTWPAIMTTMAANPALTEWLVEFERPQVSQSQLLRDTSVDVIRRNVADLEALVARRETLGYPDVLDIETGAMFRGFNDLLKQKGFRGLLRSEPELLRRVQDLGRDPAIGPDIEALAPSLQHDIGR